MFLIQLTIFLPLLTVLAHAQSDTTTTTTTTYPECCAALRTNGLSVCDFDFLGTADATTSQTACVCGIDGIDTPLNECINCMRANPQLATYADGYAAICKDYQNITTTTTTIASVTALGDNSISTAITNSTTTSATTRATTTRTSTTTAIATTTTHVPVASAVDSGNGAIGSNAPNIMLAALALLVQAGL